MQEYRCILVGIDGSPQAFLAFKKAVSIAKRNEALLLAVHVIDQQLPKMLEFAPLNEDILAKEEAKEGKWNSIGYLAGQYRDAQYGNFCFDSNVYNVTEGLAENIPDNIEEYFAVMVDMHN